MGWLKRILCWMGRHDWENYRVAKVSYTICDARNITGMDGKTVGEEFTSIRECSHCRIEQRFSRDLGWVKLC